MTRPEALERRYRRLLTCYPRAFRRDQGDELLGVLLAGAPQGQRRPRPAESLDLVAAGLSMRLRPGAPRSTPTMFAAVRLMYLGAALEIACLVTVVLTVGRLKSAVLERHPDLTGGQWHQIVHAHVLPVEIGAPLAALVWIWMAWANGRGRQWGRVVFAALFALTTMSLLSGLAQGSATYAPADLIAGGLLWLVALAALVLICHARSGPHYTATPQRT